MKNSIQLLLTISVLFLFNACTKEQQHDEHVFSRGEENVVVDKDLGFADSNTDFEISYSSASLHAVVDMNSSFQFVDGLLGGVFDMYTGKNESVERGLDCGDISFDRDFWKTPNEITIDFGSGCENEHGDLMSGSIVISYNKFLNRTGAIRTTSFNEFSLNGKSVSGTELTVNLGRNSDGHYVFQRNLSEGEFVGQDGVATINYDQYYTLAMSGGAFDFTNKNVLISGTSNGVTQDGVVYSTSIDIPLNMSVDCQCINAGIETVVIDQEQYVFDFGSGDCDANAVLTYPNGDTETERFCK